MNIWDKILDNLEAKVNPRSFATWLRPTALARDEGRTIYVSVPSELFANWLSKNYMELIKETAGDLERREAEFAFVYGEKEREGLEGKAGEATPASAPLNSKYTFDTFVVSSSNEMAHAAALRVAEQPSLTYNPLYIYGGVGLGKTHLMHAIGNHLTLTRPQLRQRYISTETFMNELISSIRFEKTVDFRERYRGIDLLLIDDIQFLAGKERTQEEFFHTFNSLYESQKQIVITSDCPPREIPTIEERLRSRFEWGLIADIQPPDLETKVAILNKKAEERQVVVPQDVALFIASRVRSNIRELEGSLIRVAAYSSVTNREIDLTLAKDVLKDVLADDSKGVSIESIQKYVSNYFHLRGPEIKSKSNTKQIAFPRQIAMYLCKALTDSSLPEIGKRFGGKHHSTVIHAIKKVETKRSLERDFDKMINSFIEALK
ncbi:MAG TPA: chromosomal replication initiator protein DnaA [Candidatus Polarisedimenticolia bacterium]|nr:chromosomal replication initiator protein DnaA [Candidatus Polarisedimenticolia bacterium]